MVRKSRLLIVGVALVAMGAIPAVGTAAGQPAPESEAPITGPELDTAVAAALEYLGEGTVTATEVGDEESYFEVEVRLDDGTQIDVQLDELFEVVRTDRDRSDEGDDD